MSDINQNVLHTLYDKLFDAITYSPAGAQNQPFDKKSSMIQFAANQAIREGDFVNAFSPLNPNGNLKTAEIFSRMVDTIPESQVQYVASGKNISTVYKDIVNGANSAVKEDPQQREIYNKAYSYLNLQQTLKDFMGNETTQIIDSPIYAKYKMNMQMYIAAFSSYRLTYNNYNLDDPKQQKDWLAKEPMLKAAIDSAWSNLQQGGAPMVEQALAALTTTINSAIRSVLDHEKQVMKMAAMASMTGGALPPWYLAYATPSDWMSASAGMNMTEIIVNSGSLVEQSDSSFSKWSARASGGWGLWSFGGSAGSSSGAEHSHMESSTFNMKAKIAVVRIYRPWFNAGLFQMENWFTDSAKKAGVSDGNGKGLLPLYPTALVVARDFELSGKFASKDTEHITKSLQTEAHGGWGPFQFGGSYAHSESHDKLKSSFDGTTLRVPGLQVIGYVNAITPSCPPLDMILKPAM